jgi:hypothetical protein
MVDDCNDGGYVSICFDETVIQKDSLYHTEIISRS